MKIKFSGDWWEVFSELFVNIGAAWFTATFIQPQVDPLNSIGDFLLYLGPDTSRTV